MQLLAISIIIILIGVWQVYFLSEINDRLEERNKILSKDDDKQQTNTTSS